MKSTTRKPDPIDHQVGKKIRERRRNLKMSQTRLGSAVDVSFQQIQKYEKGTNRVSASKLAQIAAALGVDLPYFYAGTAAGLADNSQAGFARDPEESRLIDAFSRIRDPEDRKALLRTAEQLARIGGNGS